MPEHEPLTGETWHTELFDIPAYLSAVRIAAGPPNLQLLKELHRAHVRTLPFANADVLLGHHPGVGPAEVQAQLIDRRRGGYCFEHGQIFAAALEHLGFEVRRHLGRVHSPSSSRTHMTVVAELDGRRWLCDPGFGLSITGPIALEDGATRTESHGTFAMHQRDDEGCQTWALRRGGKLAHITDALPVQPIDVRTGHLITSTGSDSPFTQHLVVMRHTEHGHITVTENTVTIRRPDHETEHREISAAEAVQLTRQSGVVLADHEARELESILGKLGP